MRVLVLGGTRFVGRAVTEELANAGHLVAVLHRGVHEPEGLEDAVHFHGERDDLAFLRGAVDEFRSEAIVDVSAMTARDAQLVVEAVEKDCRFVAISSMDVYRAWGSVRRGRVSDGAPLTEDAPLRDDRYLYRGEYEGQEYFENLDVEDVYASRNATVCRLPMVYGEHDHSRREGFVLDRLAAGRSRIPVGSAGWLWSRGYVRDIAAGVRLAVESDAAIGQTFNLCETTTWPILLWMETIMEAARGAAELVRVSERSLPKSLWITGSIAQPMLASAAKAREVLGWIPRDPRDAVYSSVAWHLAHPPVGQPREFAEDDAAFGLVGGEMGDKSG